MISLRRDPPAEQQVRDRVVSVRPVDQLPVCERSQGLLDGGGGAEAVPFEVGGGEDLSREFPAEGDQRLSLLAGEGVP